MKEEIKNLLNEIIEAQKQKVLKCGREFIPHLTSEDVLQPNDYPELENNPYFRHEEGVLEGIQTVRSSIFAFFKDA